MIAKAVNLMNFLEGPKQFTIPIYKRTYSWTLKECIQSPISLPVAVIGRALFFTAASMEAKWKN